MERKILPKELKLGMYVSRLDRPWTDTPFLFQGFRLQEQEDLDLLAKYCDFVFVDDDRARAPDDAPQLPLEPATPTGGAGGAALPERVEEYQDTARLEDELPRARTCLETLGGEIQDFLQGARAGHRLELRNIEQTMHELVGSIVRNPDAMLWLSRLKQLGDYAYDHAIETSVLAVMFGRHLGMSREDLGDLGIGGLLFDIGKVRLPPDLLNKPGKLTEAEFAEMRRHVDYGIDILEQTAGISPRVVESVYTHHERHNGRGYPQGLFGAQIPIFGKIIAIVDCFDAITSTRPYQPSVSAHHAIRQMYDWRGTDFQDELLEQFIQCLGVYPTGTIVELTTGEVGIIAAQNRSRRLRPRVMLILDEHKVAVDRNPIIDLVSVTADAHGRKLEIARSHDLGAFGIDPKAYFL